MDLDIATNKVTAFTKYSDLTAACRGGYTPTIRIFGDEDREEIRAKERLVNQLKTDGFKVFTG